MTTETDITKLQKRVDQLEKLVRSLLAKQQSTDKQLRTIKSAQHLQTANISTLQRGK